MATKPSNVPKRRRFKVGQRVLVQLANQKVRAILIEDRGTIGFGGRRLWRVREPGSSDGLVPSQEYEVPAVQLTPLPVRQTKARPRKPARPAARTRAH